MKIFYITDELLNDHSAEGVHVDQICKNLTVLSHNVTLYSPAENSFKKSGDYAHVCIASTRILYSVLLQIRIFLTLRSDVRSSRANILYVRHNHLLLAPAIISRMYHIPLVLEVNGRLLEESTLIDSTVKGRLIRFIGIAQCMDSFIVHSAAHIIAVAPAIKEYVESLNMIDPRIVSVVSNGIDADIFKPVTKVDSGNIFVGYIGSLYPWQGVRFIAEAAEIVIRARPQVSFRITGDGAEESYLHSYVAEHELAQSIQIIPAISHHAVPAAINELDICLSYPTRFRDGTTSPFKVYEYLACGKPVVVADIRGLREEFGDAVVYVEPESPSKLAAIIIALVDDPQRRTALGVRGRSFVEHGHSWRDVTKQIASLCEAVMRQNTSDQGFAKDSLNAPVSVEKN